MPAHRKSPTHIVQSVQNQIKALDPLDIILTVLDVSMSGMDRNSAVGIEMRSRSSSYDCLWLFNVWFAEEELAVQVREINGVQVDLVVSSTP